MHARVVRSRIRAGKADEALEIYRASVLASATEQEGFKSATLLRDVRTGRLISITIWETEADMLANETSGYLGEQLARIGPTLTGETTTEHYEVSFHV